MTVLIHGEETKKDSGINKEKLKKDFFQNLLDFESIYSKKKKLVFKIADEIFKKLHNIMWIDVGDDIVDVDYENLDDFYKLLKFIKKSDERKISWGLYHLFFSNGKSIQLAKIKEIVEPLKISNIERYIQKIVKDSKKDGLDIEFDGKIIKINLDKTSTKDKKIIKKILADQLEYYTRRSRRSLEQEILDMLDMGSYSVTEISKILDVDKSQVSKTMRKLENNSEIKHSSFGKQGKHFYTTNCDDCPFGTNYDACRKESIVFIKNTLEKDFGVKINEQFFEQIEYNQSLLYIKKIITEGKKDKTSKMELVTIGTLASIYQNISQQIQSNTLKKSPESSYYNLQPLVESMSIPGVVGLSIGQLTGASLIATLFEKSISSYIPKSKQKVAMTKIMNEYNKISKMISKSDL